MLLVFLWCNNAFFDVQTDGATRPAIAGIMHTLVLSVGLILVRVRLAVWTVDNHLMLLLEYDCALIIMKGRYKVNTPAYFNLAKQDRWQYNFCY